MSSSKKNIMKLEIKHSKKTGTIKQAFNRTFPFLKIEFFNLKHLPGEATAINNMIQDDVSLETINPSMKEGWLSIEPEDKVSAVEQIFQHNFGLPVQVFRKQKNVWIETTHTDHLSLAEQNEKGKIASAPAIHREPGDRYLDEGEYQ